MTKNQIESTNMLKRSNRSMYFAAKLDYSAIKEFSTIPVKQVPMITPTKYGTTKSTITSANSKNAERMNIRSYQMRGGGCGGEPATNEDPASGSCGGKSYE